MSMQDPIADMFVRIKNALAVQKNTVSMPLSSLKLRIAEVLCEEGYISGFEEDKETKQLFIELKYHYGKPVIEQLERVSKPGLRHYRQKSQLPTVKSGLGEAIITTSQGVMTARRASKLGIGGEIIGYVS